MSTLKDLLDAVKSKLTGDSHFDKAILETLKHEGGFVNDPVDPGGATNWGISMRYLKNRGDMDRDGLLDGDLDNDGDIDIDDIKSMTIEQAIDFYRSGFWDNYNYDKIDDYVIAARIFDMTVNMGARQTGLIVQRALNNSGVPTTVDGAIGPNTLKNINRADSEKLIVEIRFEHVKFYLALIEKKPALSKYKNGWLRRACH